jgi:hypothetical protein
MPWMTAVALRWDVAIFFILQRSKFISKQWQEICRDGFLDRITSPTE